MSTSQHRFILTQSTTHYQVSMVQSEINEDAKLMWVRPQKIAKRESELGKEIKVGSRVKKDH